MIVCSTPRPVHAERRVLLREAVAAPSRSSASPSRSLGLIASEMTGSGTCIDVIVTFTVPSVNVSPELAVDAEQRDDVAGVGVVDVFHRRPSACGTRRPTLTLLHLVRVLWMNSPFLSVPWYTRKYVSCPYWPSCELEREADERACRIGLEDDLLLVLARGRARRSRPRSGPAGSARTPSSRSCTPLFLKAEPHITGVHLERERRAADRAGGARRR